MNINQKKSSTPKVNKLGEVYQKINLRCILLALKSFNLEQGSTMLYLRYVHPSPIDWLYVQ